MTKLPAPDRPEEVEAYVAALFEDYHERSEEAIWEEGQARRRRTLDDLHAELMLVSRQRRFLAVPEGTDEPDLLGDCYRELLPKLKVYQLATKAIDEHMEVLREAYHANLDDNAFAQAWGRKSPRKWYTSLKVEANELRLPLAEVFPEDVISRNALRRLLWNTVDPERSALLVLAWGEMAPRNARRFLATEDRAWVDLAARLRASELTREEAYAAFYNLAEENRIPGLGPAYYTKLIYFLRYSDLDSADTGFIMDQWTATSINLIFGPKIIKMDTAKSGKSYVSWRNKAADYEMFNCLIEYLADQWRARPEHIEMTLFGRGGKNRDLWRRHVLASLRAAGEAVPEEDTEDAI